MSDFTELVDSDIDSVFINLDEFGSAHNVAGKNLKCVLDEDILDTRPAAQNSPNELGLYADRHVLYCRKSKLGFKPTVDQTITIDDKLYFVKKCHEAYDVLEIQLEANES